MIEPDDLKKFYSFIPEPMCIATLEGYFIDVNPAFSRVLGYSDNILRTRNFIEFVHPEDKDNSIAQMSVLQKHQVLQGFQNRYKHAQGHYVTLKWSVYASFNTNKLYAIAYDVSEQQKSQRRLDQIEKALQTETILVITDRHGVITEVNANFCDISGYSEQELIGKTHKLINSGFHSKDFFNRLWQTIKSGKIWTGTIKNQRKDGDFYYVKSIITPIFESNGEIDSFLAIRQDVTENNQATERLNRVLEILNETGAIAKVGGWELNVATGELTWTDETFKILEVEKTAGQKPILPEGLKLFIPEHQSIIENAVNNAIECGTPYQLELKAMTAKGNELWVSTNGKATYKNGKIVTLSGTIQDIDKQKQASLQYELEKQKSIHNAKLASLGELAASIAHEINNPLGIISGYTEMLEETLPGNSGFESKLSAIARSVNRIAHIVRSLEKYSQTDPKRQPKPIKLRTVFEEAKTLVGPKLNRYHVELKTNITTDGSVIGNEIELEQVFINLLNNALDAIKSLVTRWIKVELVELDSNVLLTITDSGKGIPESDRERIFEPFQTTKPNGEGTGLGLAIVRGILLDHSASIELDTQHKNTRFVVTFPKSGV